MSHQITFGDLHQTKFSHSLKVDTSWAIVPADTDTGNDVLFFNSEIYTASSISSSGNVRVYNLAGIQQRSWNVPNAFATAIGQFGGEIYVLGRNAIGTVKVVYVFDTVGNLQRQFDVAGVGATTRGMSVNSGEVYIVISTVGAPSIDIFNTTGTLQRSFTPGAGPADVHVFGGEVFVSTTSSTPTMSIYNTSGVLQRTFTWTAPRALSDDGTNIIYAGTGLGFIRVFTVQDQRVAFRSLVDPGTTGGLDFGNGRIYVIRQTTSGLPARLYSYKHPTTHQCFSFFDEDDDR